MTDLSVQLAAALGVARPLVLYELEFDQGDSGYFTEMILASSDEEALAIALTSSELSADFVDYVELNRSDADLSTRGRYTEWVTIARLVDELVIMDPPIRYDGFRHD